MQTKGSLGASPGTLFITNQRLILEYYDTGIPILNLFSGPTKKEIEIPLTAIKNVQKAGQQVKVEYNINGSRILYFSVDISIIKAEQMDDEDIPSIGRFGKLPLKMLKEENSVAEECAAQIRKAAGLPTK